MKHLALVLLLCAATGWAEEMVFPGGIVTGKSVERINPGKIETRLAVQATNKVFLIIDHPGYSDVAIDEEIAPCTLRKDTVDPETGRRRWIFVKPSP
jgi:hypothetical protein